MPSRIAMAVLILAALFVCSTTLAVDSSPVGVKSEEPHGGSETAVPATTEWGMMVMVLLVLTATTAAMLGGGFPNSMERSVPRAPRPSPAEEPRAESRSQKAPASPKNKSKRPFSYRVSRAHGKHDLGPGGRRANLSRHRKRREGPGCRGIR